jgi:hypothetical protein
MAETLTVTANEVPIDRLNLSLPAAQIRPAFHVIGPGFSGMRSKPNDCYTSAWIERVGDLDALEVGEAHVYSGP